MEADITIEDIITQLLRESGIPFRRYSDHKFAIFEWMAGNVALYLDTGPNFVVRPARVAAFKASDDSGRVSLDSFIKIYDLHDPSQHSELVALINLCHGAPASHRSQRPI